MEKYSQEERYNRAKKRVEKIKGFYVHACVYVVINIAVLILVYNAYDHRFNFWNFGSFSTAIFWGVGLVIHAYFVFGKNVLFGKDWESKKIAEFLKDEELNNHKWE